MKVLLILVLCTTEVSPAPKFCLSPSVDPPKEQGPEANEMNVGVYFIFDDNFQVKSNDQGQPTLLEYLLTLLNALKIQRYDYIRNRGQAQVQLNAKNVHSYVKEHFTKNRNTYAEGDVVIFISGLNLLRVPQEPKMWTGGPTIGGACGDDRVGLIHDDGQSFNGVGDLAQTIAFLLGATRDTSWSASHSQARLGFLTSAIGGGPRYGFSPESKAALLLFYETKKDNTCWKEPPANRLSQNSTDVVLPANIFQKYELPFFHPCYLAYKMHPCKKEESNKAGTVECYSFCCGSNEGIHHRQPRTAVYDGTPCREKGVCISGKCIMPPTDAMPENNET